MVAGAVLLVDEVEVLAEPAEVRSVHAHIYQGASSHSIGRGGFQQSYGPPDSVLGALEVDSVELQGSGLRCSRNGHFPPRMRGRDGVRVDQHKDTLLQCADISREQGKPTHTVMRWSERS